MLRRWAEPRIFRTMPSRTPSSRAIRTASGGLKPAGKSARRRATASFRPPLTVSHAELLSGGTDVAFRESLYLMVLAFSRLQTCREAFGRALGLTGTQFAVLIGTAYGQGQAGDQVGDEGNVQSGVSIR